jgi:hypothetical protein
MPALPQWQTRMGRKFPRVGFTTLVELETPEFIAYGQSENVSRGGLLVRCGYTFLPQTPVLIRVALSGSERLQIPARVVHCRPGVRVGVQFDSLPQEYATLLDRIAQPALQHPRRSPRLPIRLMVQMRVESDSTAQVNAETVLVSRHGCLLLTEADIEPGTAVSLWWPEGERGTQARVVSQKRCAGELPRVALEFRDVDGLLGPGFPLDTADC